MKTFTFVVDASREGQGGGNMRKAVKRNEWCALPHDFKKGDTIFEFTGHDYGCVRDDAVYGGVETVACSLEAGKNPFFTVPCAFLVDEAGVAPLGEYIMRQK